MFRKVLVANRGEIAVRVMRACEELDVRTVAIYSDADTNAGHVKYADEAYNIGPARASESYLNGDAILDVAGKANADAIHPGYGFLAENADFAAQVEESEIAWIGPSSEVMATLGEKTSARAVMESADVPVVPGTTEPVETDAEVRELADQYGYPIAIKADGGGGGRGLKVVEKPDDIESQLKAAKREGEAYFDNPTVYVEKYLESPKHIEVQVLADHHGTVRHLGERDCSLQRRHQKVIEEAPSPSLTDALRARIGEAARRGVSEVGYTNAGTVEFLVEGDEWYFLEVNTRIQVEHCVTEEISGIDIVKWQLRIAAGEKLDFDQDEVTFDGHAIEFRINAENPADKFSPTPGVLTTYDPPGGIGVRIDDASRQGDRIIADYDSMIAKVIVRASDRDECLARSERALREFAIEGVHTTVPFHRLMLTDKQFLSGSHTTRYLDEELDPASIDAAVERWGPTELASTTEKSTVSERTFTVEVNGKRFEVALEERGTPSGEGEDEHAAGREPGRRPERHRSTESQQPQTDGERVVAEMQGTVLAVEVAEGDEVVSGDVLCLLEAMKMENEILATCSGTVTQVAIEAGQTVDMGDVLIVIE